MLRDIKRRKVHNWDGSIIDVWLKDAESAPEYMYTIRIGRKKRLIAWAAIGGYENQFFINVYVLEKYRGKGLAAKVAEEAIKNSDHEEIECVPHQFEKGCDLIKKYGLKRKEGSKFIQNK
jgi:predicted GNAT family acetyltransferase